MIKKQYEIEREGQIDFFNNYQIPYQDDDSILVDNTDGIYNGVLLEFKLNINNPNSVLKQAIKYLSSIRIKGENIPATILLIDLNNTIVYQYNSIDYINDIQKVYIGSASKNNDDFVAKIPIEKYDYSDSFNSNKLKHLLKDKKTINEMYMPIDIDENCIVGWAERYYRENPKASKGDFLGDDEGKIKIIGEIREPRYFKGLINPYTDKTNEKFKYLMDCLNDRPSKKDLGAFYTPKLYAKKASELVLKAIEQVPNGNDYVIIDRCAGTGNLEEGLIGLKDKNDDEVISHCIVSTYEYYEYKVLQERIGDKVREIIPPTEKDVEYGNGKILNADAMSEEFVNNPIIKQYIDNPKCTIIIFENPPYRDITAKDKIDKKKKSFIYERYKENGTNQAAHRELSNLFIWSAFNYYLRQPTDSCIVFSPVKYFKIEGYLNKKMIDGFLFNRKHFHASKSVISCILWSNEDEKEKKEKWKLKVFDIEKEKLIQENSVEIKKVYNSFKEYNDKRKFENDKESSVFVEYSTGKESIKECKKTAINNTNIIGYLRATSFNMDSLSACLTRTITYDALTQSYGFYLRDDIYINKLPLWVAKQFPQDNWYEKDIFFTTADRKEKYTEDKDFLKSCLIYTCLHNQNKCLSFIGKDGNFYKNELCFDKGTIAFNDLIKYGVTNNDKKQIIENKLLEINNDILKKVKTLENYNQNFTYGIHQIIQEFDTFDEIGKGKSKKKVYHNPELHGNLETLKSLLKKYYKEYITSKMFEYELIK